LPALEKLPEMIPYEGEEALVKRIKKLHRKPRGGKRLGPYQIAPISKRLFEKAASMWYNKYSTEG
jgi:hypothetical protein